MIRQKFHQQQIDYRDFRDLGRDISQSFQENLQSEEIQNRKVRAFETLRNYFSGGQFARRINRYGYLYRDAVIYGSTLTRLATNDSDVDMCLIIQDNNYMSSSEANVVLNEVFEALHNREIRRCSKIEHIDNAKVPVVKFRVFGFNFDVCVWFGGSVPRNHIATKMIVAYDEIDERFIELCAFVKKWFKTLIFTSANENSMKRVIPSSYGITLMVIQYLISRDILPNLFEIKPRTFMPQETSMYKMEQLDEYDMAYDNDVINWRDRQRKNQKCGVGELFVGFLMYYCERTPLSELVIDLEDNECYDKSECDDQRGLVIYDPLDPNNPGRRCRDAKVFESIFEKALDTALYCSDYSSLYDEIMDIQVDLPSNNRRGRR